MTETDPDNAPSTDISSKKADQKPFETDEANREFRRLAQIYSWDMRIEEAVDWPERLLRRVMDIGTLEDIASMERTIGKPPLVAALTSAEIGALRPQSWSFWHYRLGLVEAGKECPAYPVRRLS